MLDLYFCSPVRPIIFTYMNNITEKYQLYGKNITIKLFCSLLFNDLLSFHYILQLFGYGKSYSQFHNLFLEFKSCMFCCVSSILIKSNKSLQKSVKNDMCVCHANLYTWVLKLMWTRGRWWQPSIMNTAFVNVLPERGRFVTV